ncbi:hypothetical protein BDN67DRAFT_966586, partial [Paxillus ammoniavirescens]
MFPHTVHPTSTVHRGVTHTREQPKDNVQFERTSEDLVGPWSTFLRLRKRIQENRLYCYNDH